jgi:hypothetical protein
VLKASRNRGRKPKKDKKGDIFMDIRMETWRMLLDYARQKNQDTSEMVIYPPDLDLDREFNVDAPYTQGEPFTAWSEDWVYFPVEYQEGYEGVSSVPRNPCDVATVHQG